MQILFTQTTDTVALYNITTYCIQQHNGINTATNAHAVLKGARYQLRVQSSCNKASTTGRHAIMYKVPKVSFLVLYL